MAKRSCIYTCSIGNYDPLPEIDIIKSSSIDAICFTDNLTLTSDTWSIVHIDPMFPADPIRSQRYVKLNPHRFVSDYDFSIYLDSTISLLVPPEEIVHTYSDHPLTLMQHSFRDTVHDEFLAVLHHGFDDNGRVFEQLNHYLLTHEYVLLEKPYWGGMIFRLHNQPQVIRFSEAWTSHVLRYSRRDQLSLNVARSITGIEINSLNFSNHSSPMHVWKSENRDRLSGIRSPLASHMPVKSTITKLEQQLSNAKKALELEKKATVKIPDYDQATDGPQGPNLMITRERDMASDFDRLGGIAISGNDSEGSQVSYSKDYTVAAKVAAGATHGERYFSIAMDGAMRDAAVLTTPWADNETSLFLMIKHSGEVDLRRVMLVDDGEGFATLKVKL